VESAEGWLAVDNTKDDWMSHYRGALSHKITFDNNVGERVHFYMGLYLAKQQGEELINDRNWIIDDEIWRIGYQSAKSYNVGGRQVLEQMLKKEDGTQCLVWYLLLVAGHDTVNKYHAKVLQALDLIKGPWRVSAIANSVRLDGAEENARKRRVQFVE